MQLGSRPRVDFPASYRGFHLVRTHGRVFALPPHLDPEEALRTGRLFEHPSVFSAATLEEIQVRIDAGEIRSDEPAVVAQVSGYDFVHFLGSLHGVPRGTGTVDLALADERRRAGVVTGKTPDELLAIIRGLEDDTPVEFAGWLPIYVNSGNCGRHPQFTHTAEPPPGYRFTCSAPPEPPVSRRPSLWNRLGQLRQQVFSLIRPFFALFQRVPGVTLSARLRLFGALVRLLASLLRRGVRPLAVLRFLQSRHFRSQLLLAPHRGLVFLTSMPYTFGQNPWVLEIEDPTTLFYPLIQNGRTGDLLIHESPYHPIVKTLLESDQCKGIVTHIRSTAELLRALFRSDTITRKVFYTPLGVKLPARWQRHEASVEEKEIHLLFINSWCQVPENFYVRGGLDILEAFAILRQRYPQLRLTLRTALPALDAHYHRILESGWVRVINRFLTSEEMAELHANSHVFLLPAARIHIVSLLQAMSHGLAVVGSDGWGMEEYLEHERNGLVVRGRYGKTSWADQEAGLLREDYEPMYTADPVVVRGLVEAVSRLVEDRALRARLGATARNDVATKYTLARWNQGLKEVFDRAARS